MGVGRDALYATAALLGAPVWVPFALRKRPFEFDRAAHTKWQADYTPLDIDCTSTAMGNTQGSGALRNCFRRDADLGADLLDLGERQPGVR